MSRHNSLAYILYSAIRTRKIYLVLVLCLSPAPSRMWHSLLRAMRNSLIGLHLASLSASHYCHGVPVPWSWVRYQVRIMLLTARRLGCIGLATAHHSRSSCQWHCDSGVGSGCTGRCFLLGEVPSHKAQSHHPRFQCPRPFAIGLPWRISHTALRGTPRHFQSNARGWTASYLPFIFGGSRLDPSPSRDMDMVRRKSGVAYHYCSHIADAGLGPADRNLYHFHSTSF